MISFFENSFNSIVSFLGLSNKKANLFVFGLDNAGKGTLLQMSYFKFYQLKDIQYYYSEELHYKHIRLRIFDIGGHETARKIWFDDNLPLIKGILFVVDTSDVERFPEAKNELQSLFETPELEGIPIAILGNKIDKKGAVSVLELKDALDLSDFSNKGRPMEFFMASKTNRKEYYQSLDWLAKFIK